MIRDISIDRDVLFLALLIFIGFSVGPMTKDIKDYKGDLQLGMRTFFTIYGMEKGTKIVAILLGIALLIPVLIFHNIIDIIIFGSVSVVISFFFYLRKKLIISYLGYGIVFSYCVFRVLRII